MERSGKCKQLYSTLWLNTVHPVTSFQPIRMLDFIYPYYNIAYYTALLNAVECSIHLNGASQRSVVNYFSIFDRCYA